MLSGRLKYQVRWKENGQDLIWWNANNDEAKNAQDFVDTVHESTLTSLHLLSNVGIALDEGR